MPIGELGRHEVQRRINEIAASSPATARITRNVIRQTFNYAIRQELADKNPAQLADVARGELRERVISDVELRAIWRAAANPGAIDDLDLAPGTGIALCLAMLTLQRGGEVVGIHARELDREARAWTIPGSRTKNHRMHVVPLAAPTIGLLDRVYDSDKWAGFAFPSPRDSRKHVDRHALTRGMSKLRVAIGIDDATPHDFRRTGATNLTGERIGIPRFIVSRVLNQISDTGGAAAVTGVYDRNEYLAEKRKALDAWAGLLEEIVAGTERAGNVVVLKKDAAR